MSDSSSLYNPGGSSPMQMCVKAFCAVRDHLNRIEQTAWLTGHCHHCALAMQHLNASSDSGSLCDSGQNTES